MALQFCDDATQDLEQIWIHWVHDAGVYAKWMNRFLGKPTNAIEIFVTFEWVQFSRMRQTSNSNNNECILYCIWANDARSRVSSVYYNLIVFFFSTVRSWTNMQRQQMQVLHGVQMNTHALNSANLQFYCNSIYLNKNNIHDSNWITRFFKICALKKANEKKIVYSSTHMTNPNF